MCDCLSSYVATGASLQRCPPRVVNVRGPFREKSQRGLCLRGKEKSTVGLFLRIGMDLLSSGADVDAAC